jgi:CRISPR-associated protein Cas2
MTIIIVERATPALRGQLTRWMLEVRTGVFVGSVSPRVREKLWALTTARNKFGGCILIARFPNEQGFVLQMSGDTTREVVDYDGLPLIRKPRIAPPLESR